MQLHTGKYINETLARGHATACITNLPDCQNILDWLNGPEGDKLSRTFAKSCLSKKPGRILKRLSPFFRSRFRQSIIDHWDRETKVISARGMAGSTENQIFHLPDDTRPIYSERAIFITKLQMQYDDGEGIKACFDIGTSMSHHALARLVQRGGIDTSTLAKDIFFILDYCTCFTDYGNNTEIRNETNMSFMLPWKGGALVAVIMDMNPIQAWEKQKKTPNYANKNHRILSVRTWLSRGQLSNHDMERMDGFEGVEAVMLPNEDTHEQLLHWIKGNARPWKFSDHTLENLTKTKDETTEPSF